MSIHTSWQHTGTVTGRVSSSEPVRAVWCGWEELVGGKSDFVFLFQESTSAASNRNQFDPTRGLEPRQLRHNKCPRCLCQPTRVTPSFSLYNNLTCLLLDIHLWRLITVKWKCGSWLKSVETIIFSISSLKAKIFIPSLLATCLVMYFIFFEVLS